MTGHPLVSAVIPTVGRTELRRAVASVADQTVPVRAVIVADRPGIDGQIRDQLDGLQYELYTTTGSERGGAARNLGTGRAETPYVAYLDDDDEWLPEKTERQLEAMAGHEDRVITSRATLVGGTSQRVVPTHVYDGTTDLASYLIRRRTIRLTENFMQTSTLLVPRTLAIRYPWPASAIRHQDWGFVIALRRRGIEFSTLPQPLVRVYQGSSGSISRSNAWKASMEWLDEFGQEADSRSRADFVAAIALRSALRARQWGPAAQLLKVATLAGAHPAAITVGLMGLRES